MEIAIIGFPQSGKTTLLNALTRGKVESVAPGGARQEPRAGVAKIPDPRLDTLARIFSPDKVVSLEIKYWDVPAAAEESGSGIGGPFLNLLQMADAIVHVVRGFEDPSVPHALGSVDPLRDAANMQEELAFSDLAILERRVQRIEVGLKGAKGHERDVLLKEGSLLQRIKDDLEREVPVREQPIHPEERDILSNYQFLTSKPVLLAFNTGEEALSRNDEVERMVRGHDRPGVKAASLCAKLEMELSQLSPEEEAEFRESMGVHDSGVDLVARMSFELLGLVSFFTHVSKEVRAWEVPANSPAVKAAGAIHSDMERGFIRAEVIAVDDLARCGSLAQGKRQGLVRLEGKSYPVQDGDVITFLFNV